MQWRKPFLFRFISMMALLVGPMTHAENRTNSMNQFIDSLQQTFHDSYAMMEWKAEHLNWSLDEQIAQMEQRISNEQALSLNSFHSMLNSFFTTAQDWHTSIRFERTGKSSLPFVIRSAQGRFFIVWIDRKKLPEDSSPLAIGDEIVNLDGVPPAQLVQRLLPQVTAGNSPSDMALAELNLTRRSGFFPEDLPSGSTIIEFKRKTEGYATNHAHVLTWEYKAEELPGYDKSSPSPMGTFYEVAEQFHARYGRHIYATPKAFDFYEEDPVPFWLGEKDSFIPELGPKVWEEVEDRYYQAYIYRNSTGKLIGYVRIRHYMPPDTAYSELETIMTRFAATTDGLVIDQLNNPGGDIMYGYFIASMLTNKVLETIPESEILNYTAAKESISELKKLNAITKSEQIESALGSKVLGGIPITMDIVEQMKGYHRNLLEDFKAGKHMSRRQPVLGMRYVAPHATIHYDKPVVVLINELDFSAGDYFPALIQENQVATLLGVKTAGAGGYIRGHRPFNQLGIAGYSTTGSISYRKGERPIENLAVTPDIEYQWTVEDLSDGFKDYIDRVNSLF